MIKFSGVEDFFIVSGNSKNREFIYVTLSELVSDKGRKPHEIFYDASNVTRWPVSVEPSEVIVSSDEQVRVKIRKNYRESGSDRIFGVMFTPDTLGGGEYNSNKYNIPFGYKAWLIIPGTDPLIGSIGVEKTKKSNKFNVKNNSNKVIDIWADYCSHAKINSCRSQLISRPYSEKTIEINSNGYPVEFSFYTTTSENKELIKRIVL